MDTWKPTQAARLLGVDETTLRQWVTKDNIGQYLSASGQGGGGRHRAYNEQDVRILVYVRDMRQSNTPIDEIHANLQRSRSADWVNLPELPPTPPGVEPVAMVPREVTDVKFRQIQAQFDKELQQLQAERDRLTDELEAERQKNVGLSEKLIETEKRLVQVEARLEALEEVRGDRDSLKENREQLQRELIDRERQTTTFWLRIIALVIVVAVVVTIVLLVLARG